VKACRAGKLKRRRGADSPEARMTAAGKTHLLKIYVLPACRQTGEGEDASPKRSETQKCIFAVNVAKGYAEAKG